MDRSDAVDTILYLMVEAGDRDPRALANSYLTAFGRERSSPDICLTVYGPAAGTSPGPNSLWMVFDHLGSPAGEQRTELLRAVEASVPAGGQMRALGTADCVETVSQPDYAMNERTNLMPMPFSAPGASLALLDAFYSEEHTPMLMKCANWRRARRCEVQPLAGERWNRLVLHDLRGDAVFADPAVQATRATPWMSRMTEHAWFTAAPRRILMRLGDA